MAKAILKKREAADLKTVAVQALKDPNAVRARDLADIAIFGRMVSNAHDLTMEGAGLFNHALTTHEVAPELDFWTAVDDHKQSGEDAGAANMGTAEHISGVFYRYVALNLTLLFDSARGHLRHIGERSVRQQLVDTFLRATLLALPSARDNSHNSHTEIGYALGLYRAKGQPLQMINAFEEPVAGQHNHGLLAPSVNNMLSHLQRVRDAYGEWVKPELELAFGSFHPPTGSEERERTRAGLDDFCRCLAEKAAA